MRHLGLNRGSIIFSIQKLGQIKTSKTSFSFIRSNKTCEKVIDEIWKHNRAYSNLFLFDNFNEKILH